MSSHYDANDPRSVRARLRADRIREKIPITKLLADYGYRVRADAGDREQQFCCDLHGDGRDSKPSARVYPYSQSWYCFACDKTRDAVELVRAKEGLDFWGALKKLEQDYGLPAMPVEQGYEMEDPGKEIRDSMAALDPHKTFDDDLKVVTLTLGAMTTPPRQLSLEQAISLWEAMDKVVIQVRGEKGEGGPWSEEKGRVALSALLTRAFEQVRENQA